MSHKYSAIDIGSNAIRMIVGSVENEQIHVLKKYRAPVRLGHDVFKTGEISDKTLKQAIETFSQFAKINRKHHIEKCRAVATSASREAKNGESFVKTIKEKTGIQIEIIDGIEEAKLIHLAVQREVDMNKHQIMLIDIGGGSVEVTFSDMGMMTGTQSFPMGTVRVLDIMQKRKIDESKLMVVMGEFIQPLSHFIESQANKDEPEFAVGTGGNLECLGRLKVQLLHRTPNTFVTLSELVLIAKKLKDIPVQDRITKLKLRPDRADVIYPAVLLVKTIMRQSGVQKILIPGVGLRDGLLWSMATH